MIVAIIKRDNDILIPRGDLVIEEADLLILGAEPYADDEHINLETGDRVFIYTKLHLSDASNIEI